MTSLLEVVLGLAKSVHNVIFRGILSETERLTEFDGVETHEGVESELSTNGRGDGEFSLGTRGLGLGKLLSDMLISGLDVLSEAQVGDSVFVADVDLGGVGEVGNHLVQGMVHLSSSALEETSTSSNEESITREESSRLIRLGSINDVVEQVAGSMARSKERLDVQSADGDLILILELLSHGRNTIIATNNDQTRNGSGHTLISFRVIIVVMSGKHVSNLHVGVLSSLQHAICEPKNG